MEDDKKKIIIAGHGSLEQTDMAKKLAKEHGAEIVVIDDKDDLEMDNIMNTLTPNYNEPKYLTLINPYAGMDDIKDMGLTNKQKNAVISPIRDSKTDPKIGRNEKCPCGSGLKYKKCCGR